jgi:chromosome segregation ATPase
VVESAEMTVLVGDLQPKLASLEEQLEGATAKVDTLEGKLQEATSHVEAVERQLEGASAEGEPAETGEDAVSGLRR